MGFQLRVCALVCFLQRLCCRGLGSRDLGFRAYGFGNMVLATQFRLLGSVRNKGVYYGGYVVIIFLWPYEPHVSYPKPYTLQRVDSTPLLHSFICQKFFAARCVHGRPVRNNLAWVLLPRSNSLE